MPDEPNRPLENRKSRSGNRNRNRKYVNLPVYGSLCDSDTCKIHVQYPCMNSYLFLFRSYLGSENGIIGNFLSSKALEPKKISFFRQTMDAKDLDVNTCWMGLEMASGTLCSFPASEQTSVQEL